MQDNKGFPQGTQGSNEYVTKQQMTSWFILQITLHEMRKD